MGRDAIEHLTQVILVIIDIAGENYKFVQVGTDIREVREDPVRHTLKGERGIHQPELHHFELKRSEAEKNVVFSLQSSETLI